MGTIQSSVGIISGIDTGSLINALIAADSKPVTDLQNDISNLQSVKTALLSINAQVLALQNTATGLADSNLYKSLLATSSNPSVLSATVDKTAAQGTYTFTPLKLVSNQSLISTGFGDPSTSAVAPSDTTLTIESAAARLDGDVKLTDLRGGAGVPRGSIRITDRSGAAATVDLGSAVTLGDVVDAINHTSGIDVTAAISGDHLTLTDHTGGTGTLRVADLGSTTTATALGLAGSVSSDTLTGSQINLVTNSTRLAQLNDGNGVRVKGTGQDDLSISTQDGSTFNVSLFGSSTLGDVISKINAAAGGSVTASIAADGLSLKLTDNTTADGTHSLTVAAANGSSAAADLGILGSASSGGELDGSRLLATLGSKLLKNLQGGAGLAAGVIDVNGTQVDFSASQSVQDLLDTINNSAAGVTASLNAAGSGIQITTNNGAALTISDVSGTLASQLGLAQASNTGTITGSNAQFRWISETTALSQLNGGTGVNAGTFTLTDSSGQSATIDLTHSAGWTLQNVISVINSRPTSIRASINSTGDGLLLTDTGGGPLTMKVTEGSGTTAADLGLLSTASGNTINGSFEKTVSIAAGSTLQNIVDAINASGTAVTASIVNDGSSSTPYRIALSSTKSGVAGRLSIDDGGIGLDLGELVKGDDAVALFGSADPSKALLLTSSSNTLSGTIPGLTVTLGSTSNTPVQINVARDTSTITQAVQSFVASYNSVFATIGKYDTFDQSSQTPGLLLGDSTVQIVENRLQNLISAKINVTGPYTALAQVGVGVDGSGQLTLDATKFAAALAANPDAVANLFTATAAAAAPTAPGGATLPTGVTLPASTALTPVGFGLKLLDVAKNITDSITGTMTLRTNAIDSQISLDNDRITQLNAQLDAKKQVLQAQFNAMESALAQMQSQSSALSQLSGIVSSSVANSKSATSSASSSSTQ